MSELENFEYHQIKNGSFYCQEVTVLKVDETKLITHLENNQKQFPSGFSNLNIAINFKAIEFKSDEECYTVAVAYIKGIQKLGHNVVGTLGIKASISKNLGVQPLKEKEDKPSLLSGNLKKDEATKLVEKKPTEEKPRATVESAPAKPEPVQPSDTRVIRGVVRGGQVVVAENEHLLIIGDVKHGAEVSSAGNITIFGKLEGRAHAGQKAKNSFIMVTDLNADLVSINGVFMTSDVLQDQITESNIKGSVLITSKDSEGKLEIRGA